MGSITLGSTAFFKKRKMGGFLHLRFRLLLLHTKMYLPKLFLKFLKLWTSLPFSKIVILYSPTFWGFLEFLDHGPRDYPLIWPLKFRIFLFYPFIPVQDPHQGEKLFFRWLHRREGMKHTFFQYIASFVVFVT